MWLWDMKFATVLKATFIERQENFQTIFTSEKFL